MPIPSLLNRRRTPLAGPNAVIAAATVGLADIQRAKRSGAWQEQAWDYYDAIGELRYAANWIGNALSRAVLFIAKNPETGGQPVKDDDLAANEALSALAGGPTGQAEMLKTLGVHLTIAGDSYLIGLNNPVENSMQQWLVRAPEEVSSYPGTLVVKINGRDVSIPEEDTAIVRIWRPHPRYSWEADSPTRGVLPVLHELERLTQMVLASANSRLAGAGLLILPSEFDFPNPAGHEPPTPADPGEDAPPPPAVAKAQAFVNRLARAMVAPVTDRSDPSAVVPVVITGPGEHIGNVRLITFWTGLDAASIDLRKEAIRRFALGMDVPPEVVLGVGGVNHWSAWAIDEAAVKLQIEPLLALICDALTVGFLRPLLGDDTEYMIWYDTTELVQRPNRGPDAVILYDRYELSGEALRRELGFTEAEAAKPEEVNDRLLRGMVVSGGAPMAPDAAVSLGIFEAVPDEPVPAEPGTEEEEEVAPEDTAPPAAETDTTGPPEQQAQTASAAVVPRQSSYPVMVAMAPVLVAHALDYVGKRWLKGQPRGVYPKGLPPSKIHERIPVPADKVDSLLAGAFDALTGAAPDHLLSGVTTYVRHLVITGTPYRPGELIAALTSGTRAANGRRTGGEPHDAARAIDRVPAPTG